MIRSDLARLQDACACAMRAIESAAIKAMRNHIVHDYWQIRPLVILRLAQSDLPALVRMLDELTKRIETSLAKP